MILGRFASQCVCAMAGVLGLAHFLDGAERDLLPSVTVGDGNILVRLEVVAEGLSIPTDMAGRWSGTPVCVYAGLGDLPDRCRIRRRLTLSERRQ